MVEVKIVNLDHKVKVPKTFEEKYYGIRKINAEIIDNYKDDIISKGVTKTLYCCYCGLVGRRNCTKCGGTSKITVDWLSYLLGRY